MKEAFLRELESAQLRAQNINLYQCAPGEDTGSRLMETPYLLYCHRGTGIFRMGGTDYPLLPEEICFCPAGVPNTIRADPVTPFLLTGFIFSLSLPENRLREALPPRQHLPRAALGKPLIEEMIRCHQLLIEPPAYADALLKAFLALLLKNDYEERIPADRRTGPARSIAEYLYENRTREVTLRELSEHFHYHPNYISRRTQELTGRSVRQLLIDYRLQSARDLLLCSAKPVKQIAEESGFVNANYFSRLFRQKTGMSPTEFRSSCRLNPIHRE